MLQVAQRLEMEEFVKDRFFDFYLLGHKPPAVNHLPKGPERCLRSVGIVGREQTDNVFINEEFGA